MDKRGTLQCRTHGQKYLQSLRSLHDCIEEFLRGSGDDKQRKQPGKNFCALVHKYETERRQLLRQNDEIAAEAGANHKWFPPYILEQEGKLSTLTFKEKLEQILPTIRALIQNK